ncbi:hypothetical protein TWF481_001210 [Arthrobotrys musiformis]|uniref:Uncharacterized protein n=1 Tax=Arthrobotrys musiformis TaxID=47236 RepID=A0AAV9WRZ1_9PEZI
MRFPLSLVPLVALVSSAFAEPAAELAGQSLDKPQNEQLPIVGRVYDPAGAPVDKGCPSRLMVGVVMSIQNTVYKYQSTLTKHHTYTIDCGAHHPGCNRATVLTVQGTRSAELSGTALPTQTITMSHTNLFKHTFYCKGNPTPVYVS